MIVMGLALSLVLGSPLGALQQEGWAETTFHRVFLRNGNFIDGRLIADKPAEIILLMKAGEMGIRRDQIDHVELIKLRTWNEKPIILPNKAKSASTPPPGTVKETDSSDLIKKAIESTPPEVKKKIDVIVYKLKMTKDPDKQFPVDQLVPLGDAGAVYVAARMGNLDPETQELAASALVSVKCEATIPILSDLLSHPSATVRANVALALSFQAGPARTRYIRALFSDPDAKVRTVAMSLLGSTEDEDLFEPLCEMMSDPSNEVRGRAIMTASKLAAKYGKKDKMVQALVRLLGEGQAEVRADAVAAIGLQGQQESWSFLTQALRDPDAKVRAAAAQALVAVAAPDSGPDVLQAIEIERDRWVRINLAQVVARLRLLKAIGILIPWLSEPEDDVKAIAESTLTSLTGEKLGRDRAKWEAWQSANGTKK